MEKESKQPLSEDMKKLLCKVTTFIPQRKNLVKVRSLLDDFHTSPNTLKKEVIKNISLNAKILTIANSPFYGLTKRITSLDFAIMVLGFEEIRQIVSALSTFNSPKLNDRQKSIIKYSVLSSHIAHKMAMDYGLEKYEEARFIAFFANSIFLSPGEVIEKIHNENFSHYEASAFVLGKWNFPQIIVDGILNLENPENQKESFKLVSIVNLGCFIAGSLLNLQENWILQEPSSVALRIIGKTNSEFKEYLDEFKESFLTMKKSLDSDEDLF